VRTFPPALKRELIGKLPNSMMTVNMLLNKTVSTNEFGGFLWGIASKTGTKFLENTLKGKTTTANDVN
jgi:hypothetical protein